MATSTSIHGGVRLGQSSSGLDQLKALDRGKANELLTNLSSNLSNRTGVVRLLHTSKTDREMTFKTAGGFKRMFLNGGKLEQSGRVIRQLLANAGAQNAQLEAFDLYLHTRGHSGVQVKRILQEIATLKKSIPTAVVASTETEALNAFGMNVKTTEQEKVGEGGFGSIYRFERGGQAMVYKQPKAAAEGWGLQLQDSSGRLLKPHQGKPTESNENLAAELNAAIFAGNHDSRDDSSVDMGSDVEDGMRMRYLDSNSVSEGASSPQGVSLSRTGLAIAARVKDDIPEAVVPSAYIIKETQPNGQERFHAVGGGQQLKSWARQQTGVSELTVASMVMPLAAGVQPLEFYKSGQVKSVNIVTADLKPMARSGLKGLQNFSKHGFIHGDIKPENMIWDAKTQTLRVIDLDSMKKISKKSGSEIPKDLGVFTKSYLHPMKVNPKAAVGVGQDLFAFGLTLLEMASNANGSKEKIENFNSLQNYLTDNQAWQRAAKREGQQEITNKLIEERNSYPIDSVENFALEAIRTAIDYEAQRFQNGGKSYDRWQVGEALHPLNVLAQHPALLDA